ncbi:MAG TPA: integrase core domain-containing protein [Candidatus Acidoferrales bacterium]|nr:integrase core domain-containing protein [Candidatus Acidoferrales bacterium]
MLESILSFIAGATVFFRSRSDTALEVLALRQQVAVLKRKRPRPVLNSLDRLFWTALRHFWSRWADVLVIVKPETVIGWHRAGFRLYWRWRSRPRGGRPKITEGIRFLIRRLAQENPDWGAPRIHGELQKLGFVVSERSVARYLRRVRRRGDPGRRWLTFLQNHREVIAAFDFFTVPTVTFQLLYCFFVIQHGRRRIVHFNVTRYPTAEWVVQQLREAFPEAGPYRYAIFDRDSTFTDEVVTFLKATGLKPKRTSVRSPWQNGIAERWVGSCRREILDHIIALNEPHLRRLIRDYVNYYHEDRIHDSLSKDTPNRRTVEPKPAAKASVISMPLLGGLHHRYAWREAA